MEADVAPSPLSTTIKVLCVCRHDEWEGTLYISIFPIGVVFYLKQSFTPCRYEINCSNDQIYSIKIRVHQNGLKDTLHSLLVKNTLLLSIPNIWPATDGKCNILMHVEKKNVYKIKFDRKS